MLERVITLLSGRSKTQGISSALTSQGSESPKVYSTDDRPRCRIVVHVGDDIPDARVI